MMTTWKTGERGVPRTGKTSLTDDQLIVCDALFSVVTAEGLFLDGDFGATFNLPFLRQIPHGEMPAILESLKRMGSIEASVSRGVRCVGITASGAALWEQERCPIWETYCLVRQHRDTGFGSLQIRGVRRDVVEAYFSAGTDAALWRLADSEINVSLEKDVELTSWKRADVVTLSAHVARRTGAVDWALYEARRCWWSTVAELLLTHGVLSR
jgi:hypothetical protein